jgi:hemoglobin-like flavoprotein
MRRKAVDERRLKESFARAAAYGDEAALFFYSHLFLGHPEVRDMFPVSMAVQRDRLLDALGRILAEVSNHDALVPFLQGLGRDHRKFGTLAEHYPAVGASLLATLAHFNGTEWNEDLAREWTEAYTVIAQVMTEAATEALQERHQGAVAGNLRDDPPERVKQPVALVSHGDREHLADLGVGEKEVRVEEERHFIAVRRRTRETLFQPPFIHGLSSAY